MSADPNPSPVDSRVHVGLAVRDASRSEAFYRSLLGAAPRLVRPGYVRFELREPAIHLSLIEVEASRPIRAEIPENHHGIEVRSPEEIEAHASRLGAAGFSLRREEETRCCHSILTRLWVRDPDGHPWEIFQVVEREAEGLASGDGTCCATTHSPATESPTDVRIPHD